jgi:hypothetical protein
LKPFEASQMSFNTPTHDSDRAPRRWAAWRRHGGGGVVVPVVLVCEVLLGTLTPPQFGHCWSSLTVVSDTYLPTMRVVWMGPLTDPKFTVSTTSTHFHLSKPPPSPPPPLHPHSPSEQCFGHSTRFPAPYRPINSRRGITRRLPALRALGITGIRPNGGRDARTCSLNGF